MITENIISEFTQGVDVDKMAAEIARLRAENDGLREDIQAYKTKAVPKIIFTGSKNTETKNESAWQKKERGRKISDGRRMAAWKRERDRLGLPHKVTFDEAETERLFDLYYQGLPSREIGFQFGMNADQVDRKLSALRMERLMPKRMKRRGVSGGRVNGQSSFI